MSDKGKAGRGESETRFFRLSCHCVPQEGGADLPLVPVLPDDADDAVPPDDAEPAPQPAGDNDPLPGPASRLGEFQRTLEKLSELLRGKGYSSKPVEDFLEELEELKKEWGDDVPGPRALDGLENRMKGKLAQQADPGTGKPLFTQEELDELWSEAAKSGHQSVPDDPADPVDPGDPADPVDLVDPPDPADHSPPGQRGGVWNLGTLRQGEVRPTTLSGHNRSCRGRRKFEFSIVEAPWLRIIGSPVVQAAMGAVESTPAVVDLTGVEPGIYDRGRLLIRCLNCPPSCKQDYQEIAILLEVEQPACEVLVTVQSVRPLLDYRPSTKLSDEAKTAADETREVIAEILRNEGQERAFGTGDGTTVAALGTYGTPLAIAQPAANEGVIFGLGHLLANTATLGNVETEIETLARGALKISLSYLLDQLAEKLGKQLVEEEIRSRRTFQALGEKLGSLAESPGGARATRELLERWQKELARLRKRLGDDAGAKALDQLEKQIGKYLTLEHHSAKGLKAIFDHLERIVEGWLYGEALISEAPTGRSFADGARVVVSCRPEPCRLSGSVAALARVEGEAMIRDLMLVGAREDQLELLGDIAEYAGWVNKTAEAMKKASDLLFSWGGHVRGEARVGLGATLPDGNRVFLALRAEGFLQRGSDGTTKEKVVRVFDEEGTEPVLLQERVDTAEDGKAGAEYYNLSAFGARHASAGTQIELRPSAEILFEGRSRSLALARGLGAAVLYGGSFWAAAYSVACHASDGEIAVYNGYKTAFLGQDPAFRRKSASRSDRFETDLDSSFMKDRSVNTPQELERRLEEAHRKAFVEPVESASERLDGERATPVADAR